jgi:hypothetical protein
MLTFCGLQESAVSAIISSPIDVLSRFSPSKEKDLFKILQKARLPAGLFGFYDLLSHFQIPP